MQIPEILKPFIEAGRRLNDLGLVKEIEFSGGTYQIQVFDENSGEDVWAFLQLDKRNVLKDCFCSCRESEDVACCQHIAAAYLRIFSLEKKPLHQRFELSIWNKLCRLYSDRLGDEPDILKHKGKGEYASSSVSGKTLFYIKAKNKTATQKLSQLILHRHRETEETSLKFSNLSQEEILLWREGKPTAELSYELSFWNDLAKWLKSLQDLNDAYKVTFENSSKGIPNYIHVEFADVECGFYISEANLPTIIPSLATINSKIKIHHQVDEAIKKITYDKTSGSLLVEAKIFEKLKKTELKKHKGYVVGNWVFVQGDGFYPIESEGLLSTPEIGPELLSKAMTDNVQMIKSRLESTTIHEEPVEVSYALSFDKDWNLHITSYLFTVGDLVKPYSRLFDEWAYVDDEGFYRLDKRPFDDVETVIEQPDVEYFVRQQRTWLNMQEGFKTHLASIEAELKYELSDDDKLTFAKRVVIADDGVESKDFGSLVYVAREGFYAKISSNIGLPVRSGIAINKDQIPLFIRMNAQDLLQVPGFFSEKCPVLKSGLSIFLTNDQKIKIVPQYHLEENYREVKVRFFDDFCFVEKEGFHELPYDSRLPDQFRYPIEIEPSNQTLFLTYELDKIKNYATFIDPCLLKPNSMSLKALSITKALEVGKGFYSLNLAIETERGLIPIYDIWSAIKKKKHFLFSKEGLIDLKLKSFDWLRLLDKNRIDRKNHTITLSTLELIRLNAFEEIQASSKKKGHDNQAVELLKELTEFRTPDEPDLTGLNSELRAYQLIGVRWLWFLYNHSLSGLLSDDMGLGKTHQTMGLLAAVINHHRKLHIETKKHFLIICPTSVIYHWQEKLQNFLPSVKVCTFHGSNRSLGEFHQDYDILLTSYGIWRIENELLSKLHFEVAIFDEIQIAKNHNSRIYSSLLQTHSEMRIGLTGTPIENHLRELKTLFDVVVPSYMPSDTDFREFFVKPIEKERSKERLELLTRFIKPFLLRRKKSQVLLDLPEKIEEVAHCELIGDQEKLYIETLEKTKAKILQDLNDEGTPVPYMHIFAVLSALKQICDHPAVYLKSADKYQDYTSGKWELFVELLSEARESRQKVVVFSQYLTMLDIMEAYCNEHSIAYATIRGSTTNRGEQIHRFNHDPECEVFLGSLQASGLGLDLTAGSVVIHYDRWWNAARENQATDRVHRIGQTRGVQVFKLVTKNTIEEKIDQIIFEKGKMMEDVVTVDDHQIIKQFDRKEIMQLFQYVSVSNNDNIGNSNNQVIET
jgi:SNF2 family DNA or RNA helicase